MRMESPLNQRLRWSPPDVVYTPIDVTSPALPAPQEFRAIPLLPGQIRLSWWRNIDVASHVNITSYQYRYRVRGVNTWTVNWTSVEQTLLPGTDEIRNFNKIYLENLDEGTDYEFWARSVDSAGHYSHSVAWLTTAIGPQTFSIEADRGPVEEGGDLYFTVSRYQGGSSSLWKHGLIHVVLRISETGDLLPQEGRAPTGFWYQMLDFGDGNATRRLVLKTFNDRGGPEPDSEVTVR